MKLHAPLNVIFLSFFFAVTVTAQETDTSTEKQKPLLQCPDGYNCQEDKILIGLITELDQTLSNVSQNGNQSILDLLQKMGSTQDPRLLPVYERLLQGPNALISVACLKALDPLSQHPDAQRIVNKLISQTSDPLILGAALNVMFNKKVTGQLAELPCPENGSCAPDEEVLSALVSLQSLEMDKRKLALEKIGTMRDDRLLDFLIRITLTRKSELKNPALAAIGNYTGIEKVQKRLWQNFNSKSSETRKTALDALAKDPAEKISDDLLVHLTKNPKDKLRGRIEEILTDRRPEQLAKLIEEERKAEEERQRKLAEEAALKANQPDFFDKNTRGVLTGTHAIAGAMAGASVSTLTADAAGMGDSDLAGLAACWGCGVGAAAAGTMSWFALADRELKGEDLNLALSTGGWTGFSAFHLVSYIDAVQNGRDGEGIDGRHYLYGIPTGVLIGTWAGTVAALNTDLTHQDVGEIHMAVALNNLLLGGIALTVPDYLQGTTYPWMQIVGTAAGYGLTLPFYKKLDLKGPGWASAAIGGLAGLASMGIYGLTLDDTATAKEKYQSSSDKLGYAMVGTSLGAASGLANYFLSENNNEHLYAQVSMGLWGAILGDMMPEALIGQTPEYGRSRFFSMAGGYAASSALALTLMHDKDVSADAVHRINMDTFAGYALARGLFNSIPNLDVSKQIDHLVATTGLLTGLGVGIWQREAQAMSKQDGINTVLNAGGAAWGGLQLGRGLYLLSSDMNLYSDNGFALSTGLALAGTGAGLALADFQSRHQKTPSDAGLMYQTWASAMGNMIGSGAGLMLSSPVAPSAQPVNGDVLIEEPEKPWAYLLGSLGLALGGGSTYFLPDGVEQDRGDLVLNPMLMGLSAWHALAIGTGFELSDQMNAGLLLTLPALASTATVALSPKLNLSFGDILMVTASAAWGNLFGLGIASSINHHSQGGLSALESGLLTTGLLDVGMGLGFALTAIDHEHLGWKFTYVASTTSIALLVASLPAALLTSGANSPVSLSDVLLASSLLGTGVGIATLGLIDFRVAPTFGLSTKPSEDNTQEKDIKMKPMDPKTSFKNLRLQPTMVAIPPVPGIADEPQMGAGFVGTF